VSLRFFSRHPFENEVKPHGIAADAAREELVKKETDYHNSTSHQPADPNVLDAQKNLPPHRRQSLHCAVTDSTEEHPAEVGMP
jgi:hypothetical protein